MRTYPQVGDAFGRYDITHVLGRGGMGVVYAAQHRDLRRDVALKLLAPDLADDAGYGSRFLREAQILARLDSEHITRIFDAGREDGWLFLVTELVPGGDLEQQLSTRGPMPKEEALSLSVHVAEGLAEAHGAGVLHRDVKPSNVLLGHDKAGRRRAVVCDFGISADLTADHTKTTGVIGTWAYLAPERLEGRPATVESDVYSLGCLLWAMVAGSPPYAGTSAQVAIGHLHEPVRQLNAPGSSHLDALLRRSMAKAPTDRFGSMDDFIRALTEAPVDDLGRPLGASDPSLALTLQRPWPLPAAPRPPGPRAVSVPAPTPASAPGPEPLPRTGAAAAHDAEPTAAQPWELSVSAMEEATDALERQLDHDVSRTRRLVATYVVILVLAALIGTVVVIAAGQHS